MTAFQNHSMSPVERDQVAIAGDPVPLHEAANVGVIDDGLSRFPEILLGHGTTVLDDLCMKV